jgi:hypothetical protein
VDSRRRSVLRVVAALATAGCVRSFACAKSHDGGTLPASVAGILLPTTAIAAEAALLARATSPPYLYNHSLRTYVFGALLAQTDNIEFDEEGIFIASCLHDLGLLERYQSTDEPFEIDSADAARQFLVARGAPDKTIELVCDAIAFHASALASRRPAQVGLVGRGAGADVFGSGLRKLSQPRIAEVVTALPRLNFKVEFRRSLLEYCVRKPRAQAGTWTDSFCRAHVTDASFPDLDALLSSSPFDE